MNKMTLRKQLVILNKCPPWCFPDGMAVWIRKEHYDPVQDWITHKPPQDTPCMLMYPDMVGTEDWVILIQFKDKWEYLNTYVPSFDNLIYTVGKAE